MSKIYLDNAATTQLDPKVFEAMNKANGTYGNPSSIHTFGQEARAIIDDARDAIARFLNCTPVEVVFTSGGSESDNLAIRGIINSLGSGVGSQGIKAPNTKHQTPHIVTSAIEHHAVLHTIQELEKEGKIEATYIKPKENGVVDVKDIEKAIRPNTVLVSVMYANNEIGTIQPIREIGKLIEKINLQRNKGQGSRAKNLGSRNSALATQNETIFFHSDAVQGAEFLNMNTKYLHVDLLTMTAHKIHGPKGIGLLFVKKGTPIKPQIVGGEQEFGKRAGTENNVAIAGFAAAIQQVTRDKDQGPRIGQLRDKLEDSLLKSIPNSYFNGDKMLRVPHISNICFKNAEGEAIILNLDFLGVAVSSGSACTAQSLDPSHVLTAIGVPRELSHGAIRFSLSKFTKEEEIEQVCEVLPGIINKLRQMSPFK